MLTEPLPPTLPAEPPPAPAPCVVIVTPVSAATLEPAPPPPAVLGSARPPPPPPPTAPPPPPPPLEPRFPPVSAPPSPPVVPVTGRSVPATCTLAGRITALRSRRAPAGATVGRRRPGRTRPASCGRGGTGTATTAGGHNRRGRRVRHDERTRSASTPSAAIQPVGAVTAGAPCSESAHATVARRSVSESASTACSTRKPAQGVVASLRCDRAGQTASCTTCGPRIWDHRAARAAAAAGTDDGEGDRATSWNDDGARGRAAGTDRGRAVRRLPRPRGSRGFRR